MVNAKFYEPYFGAMLKSLIEQGKKKFILYPNGELTNIVKQVLKSEYQLTPVFVVDNLNYDGKEIYNLEQAAKKTEDDMYYLVCSDKVDIYNILRDKLRLYIKNEQIIDLFDLFPQIDVKKIGDILEELDTEIEKLEGEYVYN